MMFSSWIVQDLRQDPTDKKRILHRILHGIAQEDLNIHVLVILSGSWKKKFLLGRHFKRINKAHVIFKLVSHTINLQHQLACQLVRFFTLHTILFYNVSGTATRELKYNAPDKFQDKKL